MVKLITNKERKLKENKPKLINNNLIIPPELIVALEDYYHKEEEPLLVKARCSSFCQFAMRMPDPLSKQMVNFSLKDRRYWVSIYDCDACKLFLKTGRQTNKSTFLGNRILFYCCNIPNYHCLYVAPTQIQTRTYISDRINAPVETSEILSSYTNRTLMDSSIEKKFLNGSKITLRYAFLSADRCRGIAGVNCLCIDEFQDILIENIGVIEQTTFTSSDKFKRFIYSGTPKTLDNPIEEYWCDQTTQNEWAIPCDNISHSTMIDGKVRGRHWNIIIDEKNIQLKGLSCDKCHKLINPQHPEARWVSLNPRSPNKEEIPYEGFHIPQLISPDCKWSTVLQDYNTKRRGVFYNETLGLSYDSSDKPITKNELMRVCSPKLLMDDWFLEKELWPRIGQGQIPIFAGIDWSGGSEASKTVLTLGAYMIDKSERKEYFTNFFWKRFEGEEAESDEQMRIIKQILHKWRVRIIGVDYGGGLHPNAELKKEFGAHKIMTYQYANPKTKLMWQARLMRTIVHRSEVLTDIITAIKSGFFVFPNWGQFETPYGRDILSVHSELDNRGMVKYIKAKSNSNDDSLHALTYSFLASLQIRPNLQVLNPGIQTKYYSMEEF